MAVDAGTINSEVRIQLDKLRGDIRSMRRQFNNFSKTNERQAGRVKRSWRDSFKRINLAGVAAFAAIGFAVKSAVQAFAGFEQSLANVESVAGATSDEMERLEQAALEAGESTRFSASEAADALYFLASAGFSAGESIDALDGVLSLATATQSDLAQTSEAVAAAISQFGLQAEDASRVSNVFAAAIANSQATMQKLQGAMRQAGPVAGALGISIEATTGAMQALFNAGFRAEQAGTALRNAFGILSNASDPVIRKLEDMGVAFEDVNVKSVGLDGAIEALNDSGIAAEDIFAAFGREVGGPMAALVQTGADEIRNMTDAVTGTNAATEAAETQMDTLQGSFDQFRSVVESTQIRLTKELAPAIRAIVDLGRRLLQRFNDISPAMRSFITTMGGVILVAGAAAVALGGLVAVLGAISLPVALITAGVIGAGGLVAAMINLAENTETAADQSRRHAQNLREEKRQADDLLSEMDELAEGSDRRKEIIEELNRIYPDLNENIDTETASTKELRDEVEKLNEERRRDVESQVLSRLSRLQEGLGQAREDVENYRIGLRNAEEQFGRNSDTYREQNRLLEQSQSAFDDLNGRINEQRQILAELRNQRILANAEVETETEETEASGEAAGETARAWQDWAAEILDVSEGLKGADAASEFLTETLPERTEAARKHAETLGEEFDATEFKIKQIRGAIEELLGIDPSEIDLPFKLTDDAIEDLSDALVKLVEKRKEDTDATEEEADAQEDVAEGMSEAADEAEKYSRKIEDLNADTQEQIELDRERALSNARNMEGTEAEIQTLKNQINEYYDLLSEKERWNQFVDNASEALDAVSQIFEGLGQLYTATADRRIRELDRQLQAELENAGVARQTELERLREELAAAKDAGDAETAAQLEEQIKRTEIEQQYEKKKAKVKYQAELQAWRMNLVSSIAQGAQAIINGFATQPFIPAGLAAGALATTLTGIELATIRQNKPEPPQFQTGGIVLGGGGRGRAVTVAENGSNELLLNDSPAGRQMLQQFAGEVARQMGGGGGTLQLQLDVDGRKLAENTISYVNNGKVRAKL